MPISYPQASTAFAKYDSGGTVPIPASRDPIVAEAHVSVLRQKGCKETEAYASRGTQFVSGPQGLELFAELRDR